MDAAGYMLTGWNYVGSYKFYFNNSGAMVQDVRSMVKGPYMAKVNRQKCCITIYAQDGGAGFRLCVLLDCLQLLPLQELSIRAKRCVGEPLWVRLTDNTVQEL